MNNIQQFLEEWKPVVGYEGLYEVSNIGKIRRVHKTVEHRVLKPYTTAFGYIRVCLSKNDKKKDSIVHRLVAQAFIPNPENKPQVNHIDSNRANNNVNNLEWVTGQENTNHAMKSGNFARGERQYNSKLKEKDVLFIRSSSLTRKELMKMFNVSESTISLIILRKGWCSV